MNTGICKRSLFRLAALLALSACSELPSFGAAKETVAKPISLLAKPVTQAQMVRGDVTLVPPSGYCIDPNSLTQRFALMARCDVLGAKNAALDAPLGLLTVSFAKSGRESLTASALVSASEAEVVETLNVENVDMIRAKTQTPPNGLSKIHLRGVAQINGYDMSLALFSPSQSAAQGARGPKMLQSIVQTSQEASVAKAVATKTSANRATQKSGLGAIFSNLFE